VNKLFTYGIIIIHVRHTKYSSVKEK